MKRLVLGLVPCVVLACSVRANVGEIAGDLPDAAAPTIRDRDDRDDGGSPVDPPPDASDGGAPDAKDDIEMGCGVSFGQRGAFVDVGIILGGRTPDLRGGNVTPGLYELTAMRVYFGSSTGTMQVRETIRVRGSTMGGAFDILTEARNATGTFHAYPLHGETKTWQTSGGPIIDIDPECPNKRFGGFHRFGASGETLTIFDEEEATERVYRRLP